MRPAFRTLAFALAIAVAAGGASAQKSGGSGDGRVRYKWKDEQGALHIEDTVPPEAAARFGYDVVNAQGMTVRRVERRKTAEELAVAKAQAAAEAEARRKQEEQAARDDQLLAAYPTVDDLRKAQESQLAMVNQNIESAATGLASQEKSLAELLAHAADLERAEKPVPPAVQKQIAGLTDTVAQQKATLERRRRERDAMQGQFAGELDHYNAIRARAEAQRRGT